MMLSHPKNRVQAIKSKFENLSIEPQKSQLYKIKNVSDKRTDKENSPKTPESDVSSDECVSNRSFLYKSDVKRSVSDSKTNLSRQTSDPGKKLQRRDAFRCDRNQISPKRHSSFNKSGVMERKLSRDRLKRLGDFLEEHMKKDNFIPPDIVGEVHHVPHISIPDEEVPPHILAQYAKVFKPLKIDKKEEKQDAMTDSGVSSETENLEEDRGKVKKLKSHFETDLQSEPIKNPDKSDSNPLELQPVLQPSLNQIQPDIIQSEPDLTSIEPLESTNLDSMEELAGSSETMKLARKNPHLILTDTLKKALKQPLPAGPPPKKPPRTFAETEKEKSDAKRKLEKLEQMLQKREANKKETKAINDKNIYDIAEENVTENITPKKPKEVHYLCTEILGITQKTLLPNTDLKNESPLSCFKLNCMTNSMSSLPYSRLSQDDSSLRRDSRLCSCSSESLNLPLLNSECKKCLANSDKTGFKCHLKCECKGCRFYVDSHIYDEPFIGDVSKSQYGTLNLSKSVEDLPAKEKENTSIYDVPFERSPTPQGPETPKSPPESPKSVPVSPEREKTPESPEKKTDFQKLLENFENGGEKAKSMESLDKKYVKRSPKFATEVKRYKHERIGLSLPKKNPQLDVDRENLNRLMDEIYETVTAACNMENKPGSFPTDQLDGSTSEESVKLTRSLTEKRKNYVRRVSSRLAYLEPKSIKNTRFRHQTSICSYKSDITDNPYSTFRSWKSFRASQNNLSNRMETSPVKSDVSDSDSLNEKTGCVDIELPFEPRENGLFNVCLLVGLNYMTGEAYVKSVFPSQVKVPQHIENLIFPETFSQDKGDWTTDAKSTQCYSFVLTDERGDRSYGYCRRVLPEGGSTCLPLCYCLIGRYRAPGFYYKVLQEIESHHGSSELETNTVLHQLFDSDFPNPGESINLTLKHNTPSLELSSDMKCKTMPDLRSGLTEFDEFDNNNGDGLRIKTIPRGLESRAEESSSCVLVDVCGAGLLVKMFASLLLERKLIIRAQTLSVLSSCMEGIQCSLYPLVWQQPLISCAPPALTEEVAAAPLPLLAGVLATQTDPPLALEEGMFIDLTHPSKVLCYQGDESTILPTNSYKTLKTSLQMETIKNNSDVRTRNVMISEAFLRFFVDILGDFWRYFSFGEGRKGDMGRGEVAFDKDTFIKNSSSKQNQFFLEWFTETAMFNHFIQNMACLYYTKILNNEPNETYRLMDVPTPNFYQLFEERIQARINRSSVDRSGYKNALNKRVKLLKARLKELVG